MFIWVVLNQLLSLLRFIFFNSKHSLVLPQRLPEVVHSEIQQLPVVVEAERGLHLHERRLVDDVAERRVHRLVARRQRLQMKKSLKKILKKVFDV